MSIDRSSTVGLAQNRRHVVLLFIIAGICLSVALACRNDPPEPAAALRVALASPDELAGSLAPNHLFGLVLDPTGRQLAFPAQNAGATRLWLRNLTTGTTQPLDGTDDAAMPFWSPDGTTLAYFAEGQLRAFSLAERSVRHVAEAPTPRGGAWHPNGDIVFAPDGTGLNRRRVSGAIEPFTTLEPGESSHRYPRLTDDGRHVVFFVRADERARHGIWIAALEEPSARKRLTNSDAEGIPIGGTLLYSSGGALVAQRIDFETLTLADRPVLLGGAVGDNAEHQLLATAAADVLLFGTSPSSQRELRWVDRSGTPEGVLGEPMDAWDVRIAPRGATVAVTRVDPQLRTLDIWAYDDQRPVPRRVSPNIDVDEAPAWSRDGARIAWVSGRRVVMVRDAAAARPEVPLRKFDNSVRVTDWAPDGKRIILTESRRETGGDVVLMASDGDGNSQDYVRSPFNETHGVVSPDSRWLAYVSDESGRAEIYLDAFPIPRSRARLTVGGGTEPRWSRDGREIFYRRGAEIHAVQLRFTANTPEATSNQRLFDAGAEVRSFDVSPDNARFLLNLPAQDAGPKPMTVIVNLGALLP